MNQEKYVFAQMVEFLDHYKFEDLSFDTMVTKGIEVLPAGINY